MKIGEINVTYCKLESDEKEMIEIPVQIKISPKYLDKVILLSCGRSFSDYLEDRLIDAVNL